MTSVHIARLAAAFLVAASAASAVPALAGEGNGPSYPGYVVPNVSIATVQLGNAAQAYAPQPGTGIDLQDTLAPNSNSAGEPEPVNSLPRGFENGMPGQSRQQELQQYWSTHR